MHLGTRRCGREAKQPTELEVLLMRGDHRVGSVHHYDFDRDSLMPVGDLLYPFPGGGDQLAEVVVSRTPTPHGTWMHEVVTVLARDVLGRDRRDVLAMARWARG